MTIMHCAFWGLFATLVSTTILAASQGLGFTRMNVPFLVGTMVTANRDRAKVYGIGLHLLNGVVLAWGYLVAFQMWGGGDVVEGLVFGATHGAFLLTVFVTLLPGIHPRMASEAEGPTVTRILEPPGFLGLYYGARTPISVFLAHLIFGLILGLALPHAE